MGKVHNCKDINHLSQETYMTCRTSAEAQKRICQESIVAGQPYLCFGADCSAWIEVAFDRQKDGDDITPKGYCALLMERVAMTRHEE